MDPAFIELRQKVVPPFNKTIANGVATSHIPKSLTYIDKVWKSISREFPPGLVYVGYEKCLPTEEYREDARKRTPTRTNRRVDTKVKRAPKAAFDIARSDVFLVKFFFRYNGEDLSPRHLYLPFVRLDKGGMIFIAGSRFAISPILQDIVISPDDDTVFAQLLCTKLIFRRHDYAFMVDQKVRSTQVVWSMIYNRTEDMTKLEPTVRMNTCLAHYLFCKYGVTNTFKKYLGIDIVMGNEDIHIEDYPRDEWVICESRGKRPSNNTRLDFVPPRLRVAIRKDDFTQDAESFVGALFYLVDHFPKRLVLKDINSEWLWKVLLGHILWTGDMNEGLLQNKVRDHFKSIDQYMDLITQQKLASIDIHVESTYDFLAHVMKNCNKWILQEDDDISSMYGKELSILNYVLEDITHAIVKTNFAIHTAYRRSQADPKSPLTLKTIEEVFKKRLKPRQIFKITSGRAAVSSVAIPGDNMAFKLTSMLIPQTSSNSGGGRRDSKSQQSSKVLDVSIADVGGYLNLQRKTPTGRTRLGMWTTLTADYITAQSKEHAALLRSTQDMIKRR